MSADIRGNATAKFAADGDLTPGEHLRAEIERLGLDQVAVSEASGVSRQSINNIVNGRQEISRAMAARLGRLTGQSSDYWLRASFPRAGGTRKNRASLRGEAGAARPLGVGILVNHQIARVVKDGIIGIDPFDESNIQLASIDLTLDDFIITTEGEKIDISDGQVFTLRRGQTVNVSTTEWVEFPQDYVGRVGAMTQLAKFGIITSHGFQVDPGFRGNLQFCVFNAGSADFELRSGMPIISLEIMPLSVTPAHDAAARQQREAGDRDKVISIFLNDVCDRLIRDAVRGCAEVEKLSGRVKAGIPELDVEAFDGSSDAALDAAVHMALSGLNVVRAKPNAARDEIRKYTNFFGEIAAHLYLTAEQARRGLMCLGLSIGSGDTLVVTLRDGKEALVHLPANAAKISLSHLARQLREDALDLLLLLVGLRQYRNHE